MRRVLGASAASEAPALAATRVAVIAALSATAMLFASLASAYLVRRSFADWGSPSLPPWAMGLLGCALWASFGIEGAVRADGERRAQALQNLGVASAVYLLGAVWVIGSILRGPGQIRAPHDAFIVILLSLHAVHAVLGTAFSTWALGHAAIAQKDGGLALVRLVTHFLTALLLAVFGLLFGLR